MDTVIGLLAFPFAFFLFLRVTAKFLDLQRDVEALKRDVRRLEGATEPADEDEG